MEIKTHPIYDKYEISSTGYYRKINTKTWLQGTLIGKSIQANLGRHHNSIQAIVAETFIGDISDKTIEHINGDISDNRVENLKLVEKRKSPKPETIQI